MGAEEFEREAAPGCLRTQRGLQLGVSRTLDQCVPCPPPTHTEVLADSVILAEP